MALWGGGQGMPCPYIIYVNETLLFEFAVDLAKRCECSERAYVPVSDRTKRNRFVKDAVKSDERWGVVGEKD